MSTPGMLNTQFLALLQQQLVGQLFEGGGSSLFGSLSKSRQKSGREMSADALTGRIRSDAGMLRQASKNLGEGGAIAGMVKNGTGSIADSLQKMYDLATDVATNGPNATSSAAYKNLADSITGVVKGTSYNGISLMDTTQWTGDDRLTVAGGGQTATLGIQAGSSSRPLTLTNFSNVLTGVDADNDLDTQVAAQSAADTLSGILETVKMQNSSYKYLESSFTGESKSVKRQADILDEAAQDSIKGAAGTPACPLCDLLKEHGKIIDHSS